MLANIGGPGLSGVSHRKDIFRDKNYASKGITRQETGWAGVAHCLAGHGLRVVRRSVFYVYNLEFVTVKHTGRLANTFKRWTKRTFNMSSHLTLSTGQVCGQRVIRNLTTLVRYLRCQALLPRQDRFHWRTFHYKATVTGQDRRSSISTRARNWTGNYAYGHRNFTLRTGQICGQSVIRS